MPERKMHDFCEDRSFLITPWTEVVHVHRSSVASENRVCACAAA